MKKIITSFTKADGELRAVIATVAFSMGLDSPNIIHWGPSGDLEMYSCTFSRQDVVGVMASSVLQYSTTA